MLGTPREPRRTDHAYDKTDALLLGAGAVLVLIGLALAADSWRSSSGAPEPSALTASADSARGRFLRRERDSAATPPADSGVTIPTVLPAESAAAVLGASAVTATATTGATASTAGILSANTSTTGTTGAGTPNTGARVPSSSAPTKPGAQAGPVTTPAAGTTAVPQPSASRQPAAGVTAPTAQPTAAPTQPSASGTTSPPATAAVPRPSTQPSPTATGQAMPAAPPPTPATAAGWSLQLGAFGSRANAEKVVAAAALQGVPARIVESGTLLKVRTSAFASRSEAETAAAKLRAGGLSPVLLKPGS